MFALPISIAAIEWRTVRSCFCAKHLIQPGSPFIACAFRFSQEAANDGSWEESRLCEIAIQEGAIVGPWEEIGAFHRRSKRKLERVDQLVGRPGEVRARFETVWMPSEKHFSSQF